MAYYDYKIVRMDGIWYVFKKGKELVDPLFESDTFTECYSFVKALEDDIDVES